MTTDGLKDGHLMPIPRTVMEDLAKQYGPGSTPDRALKGSTEAAVFYLDTNTGHLLAEEPVVAEA